MNFRTEGPVLSVQLFFYNLIYSLRTDPLILK